jgi:hypothetical protein
VTCSFVFSFVLLHGGATALVTLICVLCILRTQTSRAIYATSHTASLIIIIIIISRRTCNYTHYRSPTQHLTSVSTDGSVCQWSTKKGLVPHELMQLKVRCSTPSYTGSY